MDYHSLPATVVETWEKNIRGKLQNALQKQDLKCKFMGLFYLLLLSPSSSLLLQVMLLTVLTSKFDKRFLKVTL